MKMIVSLDEKLLAEAKELTEIASTQELIRHAIKSMMSYEATKALVSLAGTEPGLKAPPRRRWQADE